MPSPYGGLMGDNMPLLGDNQTESSPVLPSIETCHFGKGRETGNSVVCSIAESRSSCCAEDKPCDTGMCI